MALTEQRRDQVQHDILQLARTVGNAAVTAYTDWFKWWLVKSRLDRVSMVHRPTTALGLRGNLAESANNALKIDGPQSMYTVLHRFTCTELAHLARAKDGAVVSRGPGLQDLQARHEAINNRARQQELLFIFDGTPLLPPPAPGPQAQLTLYDSFRSIAPKWQAKARTRMRGDTSVNTRNRSTTGIEDRILKAVAASERQPPHPIIEYKRVFAPAPQAAAGAGAATLEAVKFVVQSTSNAEANYTCTIAATYHCTCTDFTTNGVPSLAPKPFPPRACLCLITMRVGPAPLTLP
jgi:hypothetical protein